MTLLASVPDFGAISSPMSEVATGLVPAMSGVIGSVGSVTLFFVALAALAVAAGIIMKFTHR